MPPDNWAAEAVQAANDPRDSACADARPQGAAQPGDAQDCRTPAPRKHGCCILRLTCQTKVEVKLLPWEGTGLPSMPLPMYRTKSSLTIRGLRAFIKHTLAAQGASVLAVKILLENGDIVPGDINVGELFPMVGGRNRRREP